jgi:hypothetical protein
MLQIFTITSLQTPLKAVSQNIKYIFELQY